MAPVSPYRQFRSRIRELESEVERLRQRELHELISGMRSKIAEYGITPEQLFGADLSDLAQFRDPETGRSWNGFGRPPNWIRGKDREQFRIKRPGND